jgi:futalosine hydrolase
VPFEVQGFNHFLDNCRTFSLLGEAFITGKLLDRAVLSGTTGIGKINAAIVATALLERFAIEEVWNVGCAGFFSGGPLRTGDVLISQGVLCGDEGVLTEHGPLSSKEIGIPILARQERVYFDVIPPCPLIDRLREDIPPGRYYIAGEEPLRDKNWSNGMDSSSFDSFRLAYGPSLCVGMASGDSVIADQRYLLHRAYAENMEGSAIAQACFRYETPFVECRGMSNEAGDRNKSSWRMETAVTHCQSILLRWISS